MSKTEAVLNQLRQVDPLRGSTYDPPCEERPTAPRRRRTTAAVAGAVLVLILGLTPPGQSVAESLGHLVGIGDDPSDLGGGDGPDAVTDGQTVIATGSTPSGVPFEIAVERTRLKPDATLHPGVSGVDVCTYLSFPDAHLQPNGEACEVPESYESRPAVDPRAMVNIPYGSQKLPSSEDLVITVRSLAPVATVNVSYESNGRSEQAQVTSGRFDPASLGSGGPALDDKNPVMESFAFLPSSLLGAPDPYPGRPPDMSDPVEAEQAAAEIKRVEEGLSKVTVTAEDASGAEIYRARLDEIPNLAQSLAFMR